MDTSRSFRWILASIGALALAGFALAAVSLFLNAASFAAIGQLPRASAPAPMRWSAIESGDNATYIANLRAIGCPESTIAAIVSLRARPSAQPANNDAPAPIASRRPSNAVAAVNAGVPQPMLPAPPAMPIPAANETASSPAGGDVVVASRTYSGAWVPASRSAAAPQARRAAVSAPVASSPVGSLGRAGMADQAASMAATEPSSAAQLSADDQVITAPEGNNISAPAAFQSQDAIAKLSARDRAQIDRLQKQFVDDIGGTNQDPSDPAYRRDWQTAQWRSDQRYRALFGQQALLQRQLEENQHTDSQASN